MAPWPGDAAGAAARQHRAEQRRQGGDGVGVPAARGGGVHAAGVAEQFPDGDGAVGEPHGAQVIVGRVVEPYPVLGGEPQDGGGGDEPGDAVDGEPVTGAQRLGPVQVGPASRDDPAAPPGAPPASTTPARPSSASPIAAASAATAGTAPELEVGGAATRASVTWLPTGYARKSLSRCGGSASASASKPHAAGPGAGMQRVVLGDDELFAQARGDAGKRRHHLARAIFGGGTGR